ncbi:MAG: hypothetical protein K8T25_06390 [Planctomycetia bacterium]|nr:hypothetical protein [Planctomycetia bacterium]
MAIPNRFALLLWSVGLCFVAFYASTARAAEPTTPGDAVDLFQARANGQLQTQFVAASEKRGMLVLQNRTRQPLTVHISEDMGAASVLAQAGPSAPQNLGLALPMAAGARQFTYLPQSRLPNSQSPMLHFASLSDSEPQMIPTALPRPASRDITLAAGGQFRVPMQGVCLNYGNPTPRASIHYDVLPLQQINADPRLAATLRILSEGRCSQQAAQAVAWHVANGRKWEQMVGHFGPQQLKAAQLLLQEVSKPGSQSPSPATPEKSPGERAKSPAQRDA